MCGICGIVAPDPAEHLIGVLDRMLAFLEQRGPDHRDKVVQHGIGLGHARLSITDPSEMGNQPMQRHNGDATIVFNGEIYNFRELRKQLIAAGHSFTSDSDTEVLLNGYAEWGIERLVQNIDGMFAFALHDRRKGTLYLVRDRLGKKPLYYGVSSDGKQFTFASDIRAVREVLGNSLSINFDALDHYLTELCMPQPMTIWSEVQQVPPATLITVDLTSLTINPFTYWTLTPAPLHFTSLNECLEATEAHLRSAIAKRMVADVPVACFLSGGIDSGLISALMAQLADAPIATYSIGFDYAAMNELPDARKVAERYATEHHEVVLTPDVLGVLPALISHMGEPFADSSIIPSHFACQAMGRHVKVALSGDGGDELFGGYNDYGRAFRAFEFHRSYGSGLKRTAAVALDKLTWRLHRKGENLGAHADYLKLAPHQRMYRHMGFEDTHSLYHPAFAEHRAGAAFAYLNEAYNRASSFEALPDRLMAASLHTRLLNDYLVKLDRASMYNSLEVRSPFLDTALLEFAFGVSPDLKFFEGTNKYLLKALAAKHLDPEIMHRPKRGFGIPVHQWLRAEMHDWAQMILFDGLAGRMGWFAPEKLHQLWHEHQSGRFNHVHRLWALICLELWLRDVFD